MGADPTFDGNQAIQTAANYGNIAILHQLLASTGRKHLRGLGKVAFQAWLHVGGELSIRVLAPYIEESEIEERKDHPLYGKVYDLIRRIKAENEGSSRAGPATQSGDVP